MGETAQHGDICEVKSKQVEPFFSIVIPAFNAEHYIGDCLNSIVKQKFWDYEIIVINDGSSDRTSKRIHGFADQYSQLRVIDLVVNQGAAAARNRGIDESRGQYILFVDADDIVAGDLLVRLHNKILSEQIDNLKLIVYGVVEVYFNRDNEQIGRKEIIPVATVTKNIREIREAIIKLEQQTLYGYMCNKVYNRAYLKSLNIKIPDMKILEDIFFNIQYCQNIDSIVVMDMAPYTYKKRYGTATGRLIPDYYEIHRERMRLLIAQYKSWDMFTESNRKLLAITYTRYLFSALQRVKNKEILIDEKNTREWLKCVFLSDQVYCDLIEKVDMPCTELVGFMCRILKEKKVFLILVIVNVISLTEKWMRPIYLKLK